MTLNQLIQSEHRHNTFEGSALTMSPSKLPRSRTGAADDPGMQPLLAFPPRERRDAVAKDVRRRAPQLSAISAHGLADALDVPEHWRPGSEWSITRYAGIVSVEEHAGTTLRQQNLST